jgi:hypothetical protein
MAGTELMQCRLICRWLPKSHLKPRCQKMQRLEKFTANAVDFVYSLRHFAQKLLFFLSENVN